jgi:glycosyltransferase involved in cell wall biosynthesis
MVKKILHIITRLDRGGSAENVVLSCAKLNKPDFEPMIVFGKSEVDVNNLNLPCKMFYVPQLVRNISPIKDFIAFIKIFKIINLEKPDIVHTHSSKAGILGRWAAYVSLKLKVKSKKVNVSKLKIVHTPHGHIFYGYYGKVITKLFVLIEKITARITDKLIALTEGEKNESLTYGVGKKSQWVIIHSGVDYRVQLSDYKIKKLKEELNISQNEIIIGTVARLEPVKGIKYFVEAIEIIDNLKLDVINCCKFLIVGDGKERKFLEEKCNKSNIKNKIIFTGMRDDVYELISIMDIYVQPSLNEGMGKTLVIASMLGKPIVATKVQGIPDVVKDGESGILVPPASSSILADAILKLVTDENFRKNFGEKARLFVNEKVDGWERFSIERMVFLLKNMYEKL